MKRRNRFIAFFLLILVSAFCFTVAASADMGPKPSVNVAFENMPKAKCFATLLSVRESYGPYRSFDGTEESKLGDLTDETAWQAFVDFPDADGFFFLQMTWDVSETQAIRWGYYPPEIFKILLYFPDSGTYAESEICKRYAFDTYYTVDMSDVDIAEKGIAKITAFRSYDYSNEILSLIVRIVVTVAIELGIALIFRFTAKREILIILITNVVTQVVLNVALNLVAHYSGTIAAMIWYFMTEVIVLVVEAAIYCTILRKVSQKPRRAWYYAVYALVANAVSFIAGWWIAYVMPSVF